MLKLIKIPFLLESALRRLSWDKKKLIKFQEKKLKKVIYNAYESNFFYNKLFKDNNLLPEDIKTISDLNKLPIIKKDELRSCKTEHILSRGFSTNSLRRLKTSGSTGKPLNLFLSDSEDGWRKAIYLRANIFCGQKIRDNWICITSPGHFSDTTDIQ